MPASIGVNLRVTGHCSQGGRKYMEDLFSVAYQQTEDERDLEYAFFGIYDGHGGSEAAAFAKEHLMDSIVKQRQFWSDNDEDVLKAIRNGYMLTHLNMWKELEKWPKTVTGLPSTAGTTASIAFIRRGKIYIGHVGDSAIVLGYQKDGSEEWAAKPLTLDHKPESTVEIERIQRCGGKVVSKAGVPRVVWNRPRLGHKGPIKKNTPMDEIPFLAVARSLGDLWSYNPHNDEFIVSPDPDVGVLTIDPSKFRCLIFGTDGLWNMISPDGAVSLVQATERHNEAALVGGSGNQPRDWLNPSKSLVDHALERWSNTRMRADNTSVVTLMLDPPGPPRATVLRSRTTQKSTPRVPAPAAVTPARTEEVKPEPVEDADSRHVPQNGLTIMTRYSDADRPSPAAEPERAAPPPAAPAPATAPADRGPRNGLAVPARHPDGGRPAPADERAPLPPCATIDGRLSIAPPDDAPRDDDDEDGDAITTYGNPAESYFMARLLNRSRVVNTLSDVYREIVDGRAPADARPAHEASPPPATELPEPEPEPRPEPADRAEPDDGGIQINEVSSSSPVEAPPKPRGRRPRADARRESPAAPHDRVLRSHHDEAQRPHTRRAARPRASPAPALERVVILNRRAPPPPPPLAAEPRPAPRRPPPAPAPPPPPPPDAPAGDDEGRRATRSQAGPPALALKVTRSIGGVARMLRGEESARAGNPARAPGPARRAPAARPAGPPRRPCTPRPHRSKENRGAASRRARARAAPAAPCPDAPPAPAPAPAAGRARRDEPEVHSTTGEPCGAEPAPRPRALRSRNEAEAPARAGGKRARCEDAAPAPAGGKAARLAPERVARALGKRASGPWAPALALRNRLRRRLAK